jgi:hypothetical protein
MVAGGLRRVTRGLGHTALEQNHYSRRGTHPWRLFVRPKHADSGAAGDSQRLFGLEMWIEMWIEWLEFAT